MSDYDSDSSVIHRVAVVLLLTTEVCPVASALPMFRMPCVCYARPYYLGPATGQCNFRYEN